MACLLLNWDAYPDKDVQMSDCDVCTGRVAICMEMGGDHVMVGVPGYAEGEGTG